MLRVITFVTIITFNKLQWIRLFIIQVSLLRISIPLRVMFSYFWYRYFVLSSCYSRFWLYALVLSHNLLFSNFCFIVCLLMRKLELIMLRIHPWNWKLIHSSDLLRTTTKIRYISNYLAKISFRLSLYSSLTPMTSRSTMPFVSGFAQTIMTFTHD